MRATCARCSKLIADGIVDDACEDVWHRVLCARDRSLATPAPASRVGLRGAQVHHGARDSAAAAGDPSVLREVSARSIVEHAIDPDLWRTAGWEEEPPRHFVDMDAYGPYPFKDLPHDYDEAVQALRRRSSSLKNGTLPWRAEEIYKKLVEAFTQKAPYSRDNIKFFSSVMAHYVGGRARAVPRRAQLRRPADRAVGHPLAVRDRAVRALPVDAAVVAQARRADRQSARVHLRRADREFSARPAVSMRTRRRSPGARSTTTATSRCSSARCGRSWSGGWPIRSPASASMITAAWIEAGRPALPLEAPPRRRGRSGASSGSDAVRPAAGRRDASIRRHLDRAAAPAARDARHAVAMHAPGDTRRRLPRRPPPRSPRSSPRSSAPGRRCRCA